MGDEISVEARNGGFGAARDQIINYAPSPELMAALTLPYQQLNEAQRKEIQELRKRLGTSDGILHRVATILTEHLEHGEVTFHQIPLQLIELVRRRQAAIEQEQKRAEDPDAAFAELQKKLEEALTVGDDEQARHFYQQKRDGKLAARKKRLEAAECLREAAARDLLDAAESEAGLGELARGRLEYLQAAEHFRITADLLSGEVQHASMRLNYLDRTARALYQQGEEFGDNDALREAVATLMAILGERSREKVPLQWAATQNNLGIALATLGRSESGTERLKAAVDAYQAALKEWRRESEPGQWAATQNNLGNALAMLGERESGTERLEEAVAAYDAALEECTRKRAPLDWAQTQNNLGIALQLLGQRERSTRRLEKSEAAYRAALEERKCELVPLQWAETQNNLGNTLGVLGQLESNPQRLKDSIAAFHSALEKRRRDQVPLLWATTQNNLGGAQLRLGELESGTRRLKKAVAAFNAALEERKRERVPLDWAMTQENLAMALLVLGRRLLVFGQRENSVQVLRQSVHGFEETLSVYTPQDTPYHFDKAISVLAETNALLDTLGPKTAQ